MVFYVQDVEGIEDDVKVSISDFMAYVHTSVNNAGKQYMLNDR